MSLQKIYYVPEPLKPSPNYREIVKKLIDSRQEDKQKIDEYLDHFQPTIDETREKQDQFLGKRYRSILQALERAKNNLVKYNLSLLELQDKIEKSVEIRKVLEDVNNYKTYSEALTENINKLQNQISEHTTRCKNLKRVIEYKHAALNKQNSKNLVLLREINAARHQLKKQKKTSDTQRTQQQTTFYPQKPLSQSSQKQEQLTDPQIDQIKYENKQMRYQLTSYRNNKYLKMELFNECMEAYKRYFSKSQKVVKNSGLQHSLLFFIQKAQFSLQDNAANNRYNHKNLKSVMAGRQIRNLVHDTLKQMAEDKQNKKNPSFDNLQLEWEIYKDYNAMQIVALMCLKPKIFAELSQMFQQEVLH
ncbi:unnamed protein product [Paramecium primaurelia]|uniref:Uncharacterized protein n=1 Tax=Paramecium primaurelia TaxID=5886 RepID=A0A8S1KRY1_PARPR|nr:unnamed protein product [Paramecium primaurelia]